MLRTTLDFKFERFEVFYKFVNLCFFEQVIFKVVPSRLKNCKFTYFQTRNENLNKLKEKQKSFILAQSEPTILIIVSNNPRLLKV